MKSRTLKGTMLTVFIASILIVLALPIITQAVDPEPIKIGVMGPMGWPHPAGQGIMEGATLAAEEINATGGILSRPIELIFADTARADPEAPASVWEAVGTTVAEELTAAGVDFVVGGFKCDVIRTAREVFMDSKKVFVIAGGVCDELIDCAHETCGACVRCNYTRYKYMFRAQPINLTFVFRQLTSFLSTYLLPEKLVPIYGSPVKVAVVTENLPWTEEMHENLTNPAMYPSSLGPHANVTYSTRVRHNATDLTGNLTAIKQSGAKLIIHIFSGAVGINFISQWKDMKVEALPVGINVLSQQSEMWNWTDGKCEYETILAPTGTRTPVDDLTIPFWNAYVARFGHDPRYTSWGAYGAIYALSEAIERAGTIDSDAVVVELEQTDRMAALGKFKFTQYHDVFCNEIGSTWTQGYSRTLIVQWQASRLEVIWPADQPYSKDVVCPTAFPYVFRRNVTVTHSFNDNDPALRHTFSYNGTCNMTFSLPDENGVINVTIPEESYNMEPSYDPVDNVTRQWVMTSDTYGKLYTLNGTGDVDIISMTNDTGTFFWKDGTWHPRGEEWIGDGKPDPAYSAWITGTVNVSVYLGNSTHGSFIDSRLLDFWMTTGFSENIVIELASRLNGSYMNATGFPSTGVGGIASFVGTRADLNIPWSGGLLDSQHKDESLEVRIPSFIATLSSPANLYVTDSENKHIGAHPTTGEYVNEISGAFYSGLGSHPQRIVIPNPLDGVYDIKIVGTSTGEYTLVVELATVEKITTHTYTGNISVGQILESQAIVSEGEMTSTSPSTPVGGIYIPINKLELLAPYIGLTTLLAVAVVTVVYVKKRKRHKN